MKRCKHPNRKSVWAQILGPITICPDCKAEKWGRAWISEKTVKARWAAALDK